MVLVRDNARSFFPSSLIVGQIALSILLLAAAGLFLRSLRNLSQVDLGFDPAECHRVLARRIRGQSSP